MKDLLKNKKILIIAGVVVILVLVIIVAFVLINNNSNKKEDMESLDTTLTKLGAQFYEEQYYVNLEDKDQLANFKETGLNISVTNLDVILPLDQETENLLNDRKCNFDNTKIIIYPESPYKAKNYSIKVELACEK